MRTAISFILYLAALQIAIAQSQSKYLASREFIINAPYRINEYYIDWNFGLDGSGNPVTEPKIYRLLHYKSSGLSADSSTFFGQEVVRMANGAPVTKKMDAWLRRWSPFFSTFKNAGCIEIDYQERTRSILNTAHIFDGIVETKPTTTLNYESAAQYRHVAFNEIEVDWFSNPRYRDDLWDHISMCVRFFARTSLERVDLWTLSEFPELIDILGEWELALKDPRDHDLIITDNECGTIIVLFKGVVYFATDMQAPQLDELCAQTRSFIESLGCLEDTPWTNVFCYHTNDMADGNDGF